MLAINIEDVINVLNSCKSYLIALGVILALVHGHYDRSDETAETEKEIYPLTELDRISSGGCCDREHDLLGTDVQHDLTGNRKE